MSGTNELAKSYKESETVSDHIVALKKLSIHSRFGDEDQVSFLKSTIFPIVCNFTSCVTSHYTTKYLRTKRLLFCVLCIRTKSSASSASGHVNKVSHKVHL